MREYLLLSTLFLIVGIVIGTSFVAYSEESLVPSWIKNTASFWVSGQISDREFLQSLQWLVDKQILLIPNSKLENSNANFESSKIPINVNDPSFSGVSCFRASENFVRISGKFTNMDNTNYEKIYLTFVILDKKGNVLTARNTITINNIASQQTKIFTAEWIWQDEFASCLIEVNTKKSS